MAKQVKNIAKPRKKFEKRIQPLGNAYVTSGYNNTLVTITDLDGGTICWGSAGNSGFRGSKKSTPYAATIVGENVARKASQAGVKEVTAYIKGIGSGKSQCVKALRTGGLVINRIVDITPMAHNGCRPRKRRRV